MSLRVTQIQITVTELLTEERNGNLIIASNLLIVKLLFHSEFST